MGLRIHNPASLSIHRSLDAANRRLDGNFRRLASGLRITTAADDAAGLAISERLRAEVRSLDQARRNAGDGMSLAQAAEGALSEVGSMLTRMREIAIQSNNGTLSTADRETLDGEFQSLVSEVDRISRSTEFNGIRLLDGSSSTVQLQIGARPTVDDTVQLSLSPSLATSLSLSGLDVGAGGSPTAAITAIDGAVQQVSDLRARFGAMTNRLGRAVESLSSRTEALTAAESRIRDVDMALESAAKSRNSILAQGAVALMAQANAQPRLLLRLLGDD
jgi:flagellin